MKVVAVVMVAMVAAAAAKSITFKECPGTVNPKAKLTSLTQTPDNPVKGTNTT